MRGTITHSAVCGRLIGVFLFIPAAFCLESLTLLMSHAAENIERVDINTASETELKDRLGIDDALAQRIIKHRPFVWKSQLQDSELFFSPEIFEKTKCLYELRRTQTDNTRTECDGESDPLRIFSWGTAILVLSMLWGMILTFHAPQSPPIWRIRRGRNYDLIWKSGRSLVWIALGSGCLWWAFTATFGPLYSIEQEEANLKQFFSSDQTTLLALIIALAAYTSSVEQILRGKIRARTRSQNAMIRHDVNLKYMYRTDIILVLTGAALILRIALWTFGNQDEHLDRLIIGLLVWTILYFCVNHIRLLIFAMK